ALHDAGRVSLSRPPAALVGPGTRRRPAARRPRGPRGARAMRSRPASRGPGGGGAMRSRPVHRRLGGPLALAAALLVLGSACTVGPDYVRPSMWSPDAYKEIDGWKIAHPRDDLARGPWWEIFADPQLNALEARVSISNQNLAVSEAQYREARALVREARAAYFPTVTLGLGYTR